MEDKMMVYINGRIEQLSKMIEDFPDNNNDIIIGRLQEAKEIWRYLRKINPKIAK